MQSIPRYIECRHNPEKVTYKHPLLEPILNVTYGCIVYQEQVMQIFRSLAGYSLGRADIVRRAMAKKKAKVMEEEKQVFIHSPSTSYLYKVCKLSGFSVLRSYVLAIVLDGYFRQES